MSRSPKLLPALVLGASIGCASAGPAARGPAPAGAVQLSVKSYNVECGKHHEASIIDAVGAGDADIVCLQETSPEYEAVLRRRFAERYPHQRYLHSRQTRAAGLAVLSRYPVLDRGERPAPRDLRHWHPAWYVDVETPSGTVQILLVHLRAKLSGRRSDLEALMTLRGDHLEEIEHFMRGANSDKPTLVVGDFNEEPDGAAIRWLEARGYRNALPLFDEAHTWRRPFLAWELRQTLDHILFDRAFEPLDARVLHAGSSDHLPVVARFQVVADPRWEARRPR